MTWRAGAVSPPQVTQELLRVLALPRRTWDEAETAAVVQGMTELLRTPEGTQTLRPLQAISLLEMSYTNGAFISIRVSGGKTLISLLAPAVLQSHRPLLVVPAKLVDKTKRDWMALRHHWRIPVFVQIKSYEWLGRTQAANYLEQYQPDALIFDEGHKWKNRGAAVTRRIRYYLGDHPGTKVVDMSGSITKRSLWDYAHRIQAALKGPACPIPHTYSDLEQWAYVLDERPGEWDEDGDAPRPGALESLCEPGESARSGFRRRLTETRGVIASKEQGTDCAIVIDRAPIEPPPEVVKVLHHMRSTWETPDGQTFAEATALWRHCREAALGFVYVWDPPPPQPWREARKLWAAWSRWIIGHGRRRVDSELQAVQAVDAGHYPEAAPALESWREIRDTFKPNTKPIWISDYVLRWARTAGAPVRDPDTKRTHGTLIWVQHRAFGEELAKVSGFPYYAQKGCTSSGRNILDHPPDESAIVSIRSVGEGFNLQAFRRNIIASVPTNAPEWEQLLGRTDRDGQEADVIDVVLVLTCTEHWSAINQACADARYVEETTGQPQKLLKADFTFDRLATG